MALTIQKKMIVYITAFILVAVLSVTIPAVTYFSNDMEKDYEQQVVLGMEGLNSVLDEYKEKVTNYGVILAQQPQIIEAVEKKDAAALRQLITPIAKSAKFDSVTISDEQGIVIARTHDTKAGDSVFNQNNVKLALSGTVSALVEPGTVVPLSVRAGVPVKNSAGKIVGVITPGYDANREEIVDRVKTMFHVDNTIFLGDQRISTTIINEGKRVIGTKLSEKVASIVLKEGKVYKGRAEILGKDYITAYMPLVGQDQKVIGVLFAGRDSADLAASRAKMIYTIVAIALVVLVICLGLTIWFAKNLTKPIHQLVNTAEQVARGDLTQKATVTSRDEIGLLTESFNHMVEALRSLVFRVDTMTGTLAASSEELNATADQSAQGAALAAKAVDQIAAGTKRQADSVNHITNVAEKIADSTEQISRKTQGAAVIAQETANQAEQGRKTVETTARQMEQIGAGTQTVQKAIGELAAGSAEITKIIGVISTIAGQTNLLALNAAIEAARAGEQGRGFAVVAEEVRHLAEESDLAAQQVAALIQKNQNNMDQAVAAMETGAGAVTEGIRVVALTGSAFKEIMDSIMALSAEIQAVSAEIAAIVAASHQLVGEIGQIATVGNQTAQEVDNVSAAAQGQADSMEDIASSSRQLAELAGSLQEAIEKFRVK
ncbi:MAG: methyl-accepting chemotaxis protein [Sporomusaceae bacterium]|nr:methyl-accepting chemotaxis protein [Sporomusaceae bacterium]